MEPIATRIAGVIGGHGMSSPNSSAWKVLQVLSSDGAVPKAERATLSCRSSASTASAPILLKESMAQVAEPRLRLRMAGASYLASGSVFGRDFSRYWALLFEVLQLVSATLSEQCARTPATAVPGLLQVAATDLFLRALCLSRSLFLLKC